MINNKENLKYFWDNHLKNWSSAYNKDFKKLSILEKCAHIIRTKQIENRHKFIVSLIKEKIKNKKILELGCGNGVLSKEIIKMQPAHLTCIDISEIAINITKKKLINIYDNNKIEFINGDIETIKIDFDRFDLILGLGISQYLNQDIIKKIFFSSRSNFCFDYINSELSLLNILHSIYRFLKFFGKKRKFPNYNKFNSKILMSLNKFNKDICFLKKDNIYYIYYL